MPDVYEIQDSRTGETFEIESDHQPTPDEAKTAMAKYRVTTAKAKGGPMMGAAPPSGMQKFLGQINTAMGPRVPMSEYPGPNPIGPKAREFLTQPVARPTGIDAIDQILSPVNLALGAGAGVAGAMERGAVGLAGRGIGAVKGAMGAATPVIKYEVVKTALRSVGIPESVASVIAMTLSSGGGKAPTEAAPTGAISAAEKAALAKQGYSPDVIAKIEAQLGAQPAKGPATTPAELEATLRKKPSTSPGGSVSGDAAPPANPQSSPVPAKAPTGGLPDQKALNEQAIARRRAEYQQRQQAESSGADEAYARQRAMGKSDADAQAAVTKASELQAALGVKTPTQAETKFPKGMRGKRSPAPARELNPPAKEYASTENPTSPVQREVENAKANESQQDASYRAWRANADKVAQNPEAATPQDLNRASGYLSHKLVSLRKAAESAGKVLDKDVAAGINSEMDYYTRLAKEKGAPARKTAGTKGAKIADSQAGADSLEQLQDAIHGPDAPSKGNGTYQAPRSAADWANEMGRLRDLKPRPIDKLYGTKGPTPEQAAEHATAMKEWQKAYYRASREQKIALQRDNDAFERGRK